LWLYVCENQTSFIDNIFLLYVWKMCVCVCVCLCVCGVCVCVCTYILLNGVHYSECALTGAKDKPCQYRMRLKDSDNWHYISLSARNKVQTVTTLIDHLQFLLHIQIATVCNFFMFLRHIQQGLVKTTSKCGVHHSNSMYCISPQQLKLFILNYVNFVCQCT